MFGVLAAIGPAIYAAVAQQNPYMDLVPKNVILFEPIDSVMRIPKFDHPNLMGYGMESYCTGTVCFPETEDSNQPL